MKADKSALLELRAKTRAGMQDCLRTLEETGGDVLRAEALLVERGLAAVGERAARETPEGRVFGLRAGGRAALVQLECETDFVALGADFRAAGERAAELACASARGGSDPAIAELVADLARVTRENVVLRKVAALEAGPSEALDCYVHGDGSVGALVLARATGPGALGDPEGAAFLHDLALHVAAFAPRFLDESAVPDSYRKEKEAEFRARLEEEGKLGGKGAAMVDSILAGKMRRHLRDVCLLGRGFVRDEKRSVAEALRDLNARTGAGLAVAGYAYCRVGEA